MARELSPIDIYEAPELAWLVEEVETTGKRRRFTRGDRDVAVLVPVTPAAAATANAVLAELNRCRRAGWDIVAATAGIIQYDGPVLTRDQEKAAFA
jgi:hypothetical protein